MKIIRLHVVRIPVRVRNKQQTCPVCGNKEILPKRTFCWLCGSKLEKELVRF